MKTCTCGVTGPIHRRTPGAHHWDDCAQYVKPTSKIEDIMHDTRPAWVRNMVKNAHELMR